MNSPSLNTKTPAQAMLKRAKVSASITGDKRIVG
jgi:hypothetical protein